MILKQVIVTVEDDRQAQAVLKVLARAEENGRLDFAFGTEVRDVNRFEDDKPATAEEVRP